MKFAIEKEKNFIIFRLYYFRIWDFVALVKIKQPSRLNRIQSAQRASGGHWWLLASKPKKTGRLSQLNKHNRRFPSEFIRMAIKIEDANLGR